MSRFEDCAKVDPHYCYSPVAFVTSHFVSGSSNWSQGALAWEDGGEGMR